ncbi:MAG: ferritin family protein [Magnetococcales bacterium]|nr:ferritin family protein [Magnetococcales bacterium]
MEDVINLFKKAITGEVTAKSFYTLASDVTVNAEVSKIFLGISIMEGDHADTLIKKIANLKGVEQFDGQLFLDELLKQNKTIFAGGSEIIKNGTPKQALEFAISMEYKAKETYDKLAEATDDLELKNACLEMAEEEAAHIQQLTNILNSLDKWGGTLFLNTRTRS